MDIKLNVTKVVFDRQRLLAKQSKKEEGTMMRLGGFYRKVVQRSMRNGNLKRGAVTSEPGQPPRYHTKALRDGMRFQYDRGRHSVFVFAEKLNGKRMLSSQPGPMLLEFGGRAKVGRQKVRRVHVRPRPFVGERSINWPKVVDRLKKDRANLGI